jgi:AcrR family transcriptional regulator
MIGSKDLTPAQERILVESEKVLGKKGISGLELKNIAKILKLAPSTINYYYTSSEDLIYDTTLFSYQKYVQQIFDESEGILDPEKVLRIWIKNTFDWTWSSDQAQISWTWISEQAVISANWITDQINNGWRVVNEQWLPAIKFW